MPPWLLQSLWTRRNEAKDLRSSPLRRPIVADRLLHVTGPVGDLSLALTRSVRSHLWPASSQGHRQQGSNSPVPGSFYGTPFAHAESSLKHGTGLSRVLCTCRIRTGVAFCKTRVNSQFDVDFEALLCPILDLDLRSPCLVQFSMYAALFVACGGGRTCPGEELPAGIVAVVEKLTRHSGFEQATSAPSETKLGSNGTQLCGLISFVSFHVLLRSPQLAVHLEALP